MMCDALEPTGGGPTPWSHPARVAAVARVFGCDAPAPETARVMAIGAGACLGLIALAAAFPSARFTAVQRSPAAVRRGRSDAEALGLDNLSLIEGGLDEAAAVGEVDYLLAEEAFAGASEVERGRILGIAGAQLAPRGVALIGCDSYPGAAAEQVTHELMRYHAAVATDSAAGARSASEALRFFADAVSPAEVAYKIVLAQAAAQLEERDARVALERSAARGRPRYFHELSAELSAAGLRYLGEAALPDGAEQRLPRALVADLRARAGGDRDRFEQLADFALNRRRRRALIVRGEVPLPDAPDAALARGLIAYSTAVPMEPDRAWRVGEVTFRDVPEAVDGMLTRLWRARPEGLPAAALDPGLEEVLEAWGAGALELVAAPLVAGRAGARPRLAPLARLQLERGDKTCTSAFLEPVELTSPLPVLARLLDGDRDRPALLAALEAVARVGELALPVPEPDEETLRAGLSVALDRGVARLERLGLLSAGARGAPWVPAPARFEELAGEGGARGTASVSAVPSLAVGAGDAGDASPSAGRAAPVSAVPNLAVGAGDAGDASPSAGRAAPVSAVPSLAVEAGDAGDASPSAGRAAPGSAVPNLAVGAGDAGDASPSAGRAAPVSAANLAVDVSARSSAREASRRAEAVSAAPPPVVAAPSVLLPTTSVASSSAAPGASRTLAEITAPVVAPPAVAAATVPARAASDAGALPALPARFDLAIVPGQPGFRASDQGVRALLDYLRTSRALLPSERVDEGAGTTRLLPGDWVHSLFVEGGAPPDEGPLVAAAWLHVHENATRLPFGDEGAAYHLWLELRGVPYDRPSEAFLQRLHQILWLRPRVVCAPAGALPA